MKEIKPAYKSQTIWFGVLTLAASASALLTKPDLYSKLGKCADTFDQAGIAKLMNDVVPIVTALGGIGAVTSRFKTGGIYTPKGIFGPNKDDLVREKTELDDQVAILRDVRATLQDVKSKNATTSLQTIIANPMPLTTLIPVNLDKLAEEFDA